jgi:hypothetical protein
MSPRRPPAKKPNAKTATGSKPRKPMLKSKDFPVGKTSIQRPAKGVKWADLEPKGQQRIQLNKVCPKCILIKPKSNAPKSMKQDAKNYKFPICAKPKPKASSKVATPKKLPACTVSCTGLLAANRRARLTRIYPDVQKLTGKLLQKFKCTKASVEREKKKLMSKKNKTTKTTVKKNVPKKK